MKQSNNKPSIPQKRIKKIGLSDDPQSAFYELENKAMTPFAKLTLEKLKTSGSECANENSELKEFDMFDYSDPMKRYFITIIHKRIDIF